MILGRTSSIRGVSYPNYKILSMVAEGGAGLTLTNRQERVYTNRFGERIYEDILHFRRDGEVSDNPTAFGRSVGVWALRQSLETAPTDRLDEIRRAIGNAMDQKGSPLFDENQRFVL